MQRAVHVSRGGRRSGVIVGGRPLVPASVVPEDLISQVCEVILSFLINNKACCCDSLLDSNSISVTF